MTIRTIAIRALFGKLVVNAHQASACIRSDEEAAVVRGICPDPGRYEHPKRTASFNWNDGANHG